ncbi:MAG: ThiF family adenylyltransferase [Actinobacteria bacterium]|nr:ThiF family adenylyltransferase [Actinomycetota bacterium]
MDFVVAAVDNIRGRTYIDGQCVLHEKAMFDSGTSATKGSTQVVIPRHTQTYSDSADPP